ncbi:PREDICTED: histone-lysine N-methyltransferase ASHR3-like isoform X2 [Camelina sativa]|uniref:Histone-lysine N-methyltransferase ASHR3-like isoform X2 n=1 Tax=Camelina sativa TaxID=90675 RepID=A0ABM0UA08_CAMSA|nr:PREDICTED: histone-lysine N-methyltransferase ASHR3-like isoform X2 [Camelina sativa]
MLDLGNMSLSASVALTCCPAFLPAASGPELAKSIDSPENVAGDSNGEQLPEEEVGDVKISSGVTALIRKQNPSDRAKKGLILNDHVKDWVKRRVASGVSESRCFLPFLVGAKKMVDCLVCHKPVYPGEEVLCSVRGCQGAYHLLCAKESLSVSKSGKFKCPQHECFLCKGRALWRCIKCPMAAHDKHSPWPEEILHLKDQPGKAVCWRHPTDWRQDTKHAVAQSEMEVFSQLPLPYVEEEFKIDFTWKDSVVKDDPPPYVHIRRNIYFVKKKRDDANDGVGCTNCGPTCCRSCVCRVQCISCSKGCGCPETCGNRPFRKEKKMKIVKTEHCGWGVEAAEPINKEDFIIEYIGEVISDAQCEQRLWDMKNKGINEFYMCEIHKDFTIDATFKGNTSRFLNHSCDPNCVLEKWQVEGEIRIGVFAARQIKAGEPLTYDYRFVQFGPEVKCNCGSYNFQGNLGTKRKEPNRLVASWGAKRRRVLHQPKAQ